MRKEWRDKISKANKGKIRTLEQRIRIGLSGKGRVPWNKGKKEKGKDVLEKQSQSHIGKKRSIESVKKTNDALRGKKRPLWVRDKISKGRIGLRYNFGKDHWNWKGGITKDNAKIRFSYEQKEWRKNIFLRDNFSCKKCGQTGGDIQAHHIFNFSDFPEFRLEINNGITFCKKCHKRFHKIYGRKNNVKQQLEEFLNNII